MCSGNVNSDVHSSTAVKMENNWAGVLHGVACKKTTHMGNFKCLGWVFMLVFHGPQRPEKLHGVWRWEKLQSRFSRLRAPGAARADKGRALPVAVLPCRGQTRELRLA